VPARAVGVTAVEANGRATGALLPSLTHQLRSSAAAIRGAVDVLRDGAKERPAECERFLGHIERQALRLERLAGSMLMLARVQGAGEAVERGPVALRPFLDEVAAGTRLAWAADVSVACPVGLVVSTNEDLLEHALVNLAENAARHGGGGRVRIRARDATPAGSVTIEIHDDGPGIPERDRARVLGQAPNGWAADDGARGLGLAIARQAVDAVGGRLELNLPPGGGTTARVTLPGPRSGGP
jgi:signal transduction histidine kinase